MQYIYIYEASQSQPKQTHTAPPILLRPHRQFNSHQQQTLHAKPLSSSLRRSFKDNPLHPTPLYSLKLTPLHANPSHCASRDAVRLPPAPSTPAHVASCTLIKCIAISSNFKKLRQSNLEGKSAEIRTKVHR